MADCKDCIHYDACLKFADLRVILCGDKADTKCGMFKPTASVAPRAEVAREIFWEMDKLLLSITIDEEAEESFVGFDFDKYLALKKKYTEAEPPEGDES